MKAEISFQNKTYVADLRSPLDISIPLRAGEKNVNAWYIGPATIEPVVTGDWVGEVSQGGTVNFRNIFFNPHGHGTHTECVGHISKEWYSVNQVLQNFFSVAKLITITPEKIESDEVITLEKLKTVLGNEIPESVILRTLPNNENKLTKHYSNTNPPYLDPEAALYLRERNVKHLLIDLPSVDPEKDDGRLSAHKNFWNYPESPRLDSTITEFIFVKDSVIDGLYLLNLMIAPFENDASPSKPVLYRLS
jgi:kynurenine formamidase